MGIGRFEAAGVMDVDGGWDGVGVCRCGVWVWVCSWKGRVGAGDGVRLVDVPAERFFRFRVGFRLAPCGAFLAVAVSDAEFVASPPPSGEVDKEERQQAGRGSDGREDASGGVGAEGFKHLRREEREEGAKERAQGEEGGERA